MPNLLPSRRSFLSGLASLVAAPALVRASSLMPIRGAPLISMRILTNYNPVEDSWVDGPDILYGWLRVRPEWTLDLFGTKNV